MDNSFREKESSRQQDQEPQGLLKSLPMLTNFIQWLAGLFEWPEEEREDAGIYIDRMADE